MHPHRQLLTISWTMSEGKDFHYWIDMYLRDAMYGQCHFEAFEFRVSFYFSVTRTSMSKRFRAPTSWYRSKAHAQMCRFGVMTSLDAPLKTCGRKKKVKILGISKNGWKWRFFIFNFCLEKIENSPISEWYTQLTHYCRTSKNGRFLILNKSYLKI